MSDLFKAAHIRAKADLAFDGSKPYAYYFRLQLINGLVEKAGGPKHGFQIVEPRRLWA